MAGPASGPSTRRTCFCETQGRLRVIYAFVKLCDAEGATETTKHAGLEGSASNTGSSEENPFGDENDISQLRHLSVLFGAGEILQTPANTYLTRAALASRLSSGCERSHSRLH